MFVLKLSCSANVKVIILMSWEQFLQMLLAAWSLSYHNLRLFEEKYAAYGTARLSAGVMAKIYPWRYERTHILLYKTEGYNSPWILN